MDVGDIVSKDEKEGYMGGGHKTACLSGHSIVAAAYTH